MKKTQEYNKVANYSSIQEQEITKYTGSLGPKESPNTESHGYTRNLTNFQFIRVSYCRIDAEILIPSAA